MTCINILGMTLEVRHIAQADASLGRAPIVFLHEGLGSVAQWQGRDGYWPQQVCAATGRAGLVYSRRGYGQSEAVPDVRGTGRLQPDYMHREAWEVLPALLQATGITQPVLLGHSDGGTIALLHAARHAVTACVVLAPHVMVEPESLEAIAQVRDAYNASDREPAGLRARLARHHADVDCAFWQWNDVWLSEDFSSFDIRSECAGISAPLLAMQGTADRYGTMAQIASLLASESASRGALLLQKMEHCGHAPHKDQPQQTLQHIASFLQDLP